MSTHQLDYLERLAVYQGHKSATDFQTRWRMHVAARVMEHMRCDRHAGDVALYLFRARMRATMAIKLQAWIRGRLGHMYVTWVRRMWVLKSQHSTHVASIRIQSEWRMFSMRSKYIEVAAQRNGFKGLLQPQEGTYTNGFGLVGTAVPARRAQGLHV